MTDLLSLGKHALQEVVENNNSHPTMLQRDPDTFLTSPDTCPLSLSIRPDTDLTHLPVDPPQTEGRTKTDLLKIQWVAQANSLAWRTDKDVIKCRLTNQNPKEPVSNLSRGGKFKII